MKIGNLKKVDIRDLWKGEATDFTPKKAASSQNLTNAKALNLEYWTSMKFFLKKKEPF